MASSVFILPFLLAVLSAATSASNEAPVNSSLVVGGTNARNGEVPWMVAMSAGRTIQGYFCAGSLVSSRHILTAAHCIDSVYTKALSRTLRIHVGSIEWNSGSTVYTIRSNITHPKWDYKTIKNDLGFLITENPVTFTNLVKAVALNLDPVPSDKSVMVAGWGRLEVNGDVPQYLQREFLMTVDGKKCVEMIHKYNVDNKGIGKPEVDPSVELCVFGGTGHGSCNGDSGAPGVQTKPRAEQVGVTSWGVPCALGVPDVLASLSGNRQFIEKSLKVTL